MKRLEEVDSVCGKSGLFKTKPVKITLSENTEHCCLTTTREVPFSIMERVEQKLKEVEKDNIIQKISKSTDWCAPMLPVMKKNGDV